MGGEMSTGFMETLSQNIHQRYRIRKLTFYAATGISLGLAAAVLYRAPVETIRMYGATSTIVAVAPRATRVILRRLQPY